ncbi:MAG: NAD(P)/FAD-dependent oxidoreductase [Blautia sp.]|nr:NAD(P)/FAD-dependent oxidoreductase [Blautia sp.]
MERYDIIIVGTGPAGISAAITATIRKRKILLIGSRHLSTKVEKAHEILNYPGLPAVSGEDLKNALLAHLDSMNIPITEERVTLIYPMGDFFAVQSGNNNYEASSIILATGVVAGKPLPNEEEYLGRGVSYCATCDAALYRGKNVAIVGFSAKEEEEADFMTEYAARVVYFPQYAEETHTKEGVEVIREKVTSIVPQGFKAGGVETAEGNTYSFDGVFILRDSVSPKQLLPGLELDGNHVKVARDLSTNVSGCFACGDIAGLPYQYIKSAGEGNVAALSAVKYLASVQN